MQLQLVLAASTFRTAANRSREKQLIQELVTRYNNAGLVGRPVRNSSEQLTVEFGLAIIQILDLDENGQFLRTNCWLRFGWNDPLLDWQSWNDSRYENITQIRLYPELVWTPDISLYNFVDERMNQQRTARIVAYANGMVMWVPQSLLKSTCPVEIDYFPFDTQLCFLEFGSTSYDVTELNLTWYGYEYAPATYEPNPYVDFTNYIKSHEWRTDGQDEYLVRPSQRQLQIKSRIKCKRQVEFDPDGRMRLRTYKRLEYKLRIRRNPDFYVMILLLPCMLLSILTWVIFWLPPESTAKTQLGMNILLAFNILMLLLARTTPSNSRNFPLIGYFYAFNMALITLSTFLAVLVINLYLRADRRAPMHPVMRNIFVEGFGRLFLVRQAIPLQASTHYRSANMRQIRSQQLQHHHQHHQQQQAHLSQKHQDAAVQSMELNAQSLTDDRDTDSPLLPAGVSGVSGVVERQLREIKQFMKVYVSRLKEKDRRNMLAMEWRAFAIVLDRIFFTAYVLGIVIAVIVLFPRTHDAGTYDHNDPYEVDYCGSS